MMRGRLKADSLKAGVLFEPPLSKSDAIRLLFVQHACGARLEQFNSHAPEDVLVCRAALARLAASSGECDLSMGVGAAPFRFILALASVDAGKVTHLDAERTLRSRPHGPFVGSLEAALGPRGLRIDSRSWPLTVDARGLRLQRKLVFSIVPESSQYVTALLLAGARLVACGSCSEVSVVLQGEPASAGYLGLTREWLEAAGFAIAVQANAWQVTGYRAGAISRAVPPDWSSAAYLAVWAWRCGGGVRVERRGGHPDAAVLTVLEEAGVRSEIDGHSTLRLSGPLRRGLRACAAECPDLIPTLAALAMAAPSASVFESVGILRGKESDRVEFIERLAASAGGRATAREDKLILEPPARLAARVEIETGGDHRRALAGSVLAALGEVEVFFDDIACVAKSFPDYWDEIDRCGATLEVC